MPKRDAKENIQVAIKDSFGILASQTMYGGTLACGITTDGYVRPAADTANFLTRGLVPSDRTYTEATAVSGAETCPVLSGCHAWMDNDATNPVLAAELGKVCYVKTASSVCATGGSAQSIVAGIAQKLETIDGVAKVKIWIPHGGYAS